MKKNLLVFTFLILMTLTLLGCNKTEDGQNVIIVGASPTPHAEILEQAIPLMKEKGYELKIKEFSDYVLPNIALQDKDIDANYFQHKPYLDEFNKEKNTDLVSAGAVHYEPFGIYSEHYTSLENVKDCAVISVPNDVSNEARALLLLESVGLIKIKENVGINATINDIESNPKGLQIREIEAAQLVRSLPDVDFAVINGNYAIQGGLYVSNALALEQNTSLSATTYANIVAIRPEDEEKESIKYLLEILKSDEIKSFINSKYGGSVMTVE